MPRQDRVNPIAAEVRAIEEGLRAYPNGDGTFRVRSSSRPALWWTVEVAAWRSAKGWRIKFACTCEGGQARPSEATPCLHSACVGRSLERRGLAYWTEGLWAPSDDLMGKVV